MQFAKILIAISQLLAVSSAFKISKFNETKRSLVDYNKLRNSIVRIQAVSGTFDWSQPYAPPGEGVGLGSGFIVQTEPYLLFATNQHVINDASQVTLQLLVFGERQWDVDVVKTCPKFDLSLLVLRNDSEFKTAMASKGITPTALPLSEKVAQMGEDVVALGFPLGQNSLKISKGNVAGNQIVNGNLCIQSTAPISPGNSGGPLLDRSGAEVVGVNFAKATGGENINYVIPAWRVQQLKAQHLADQPEKPANGRFKRLPLRVPHHGLTTVEPNEELYTLSGCNKGIYMARLSETGFMNQAAEPKVPVGSMLTSVAGSELDRFGMGNFEKFAADKVSFADLFFMMPKLSGSVEFETCKGGKVTKHTVSMKYKDEYDRGLMYVDEPVVTGMGEQYEQFGDIVVMQMTQNHVYHFMQTTGVNALARWLEPESITKPRLMITHVRAGSYAADVLPPGGSIERLNGKKVRTLDEWRAALLPDDNSDVWTLETDRGLKIALPLKRTVLGQIALAKNAPHVASPGFLALAKQLLNKQKAKVAAKKEKNTEQKDDSVIDIVGKIQPWGQTTALAKKGNSKKQTSLLQQKKASVEIRAAGPLLFSKTPAAPQQL
eukprot:TRINITY_DN461_c0_g1_i1.p1 TRINITY_DN461_c0_g1~~TRINITY_DN461_c0_g1_i1.p1  ORF type:complete len:605 (+),score=166.79 TRINITY_DN461_c0_g1_i1:98-1912(+)